jgi:putative transposase
VTRPWRGLDDVEFATMTYVDWFNHRRLHGEITNTTTYTIEAITHNPSSHQTRGGSQWVTTDMRFSP